MANNGSLLKLYNVQYSEFSVLARNVYFLGSKETMFFSLLFSDIFNKVNGF